MASIFVSALPFLAAIGPASLGIGEAALSAAFGLGGVGGLGYIRAMLPRWADRRAAQMDAIAERIPLLMKGEGS